MQPILSANEEWSEGTRRVGRRVLVFDCLDSTNSYAATLAQDAANDGIVILAKEQTAGRGQHGRSWRCPAGTGVLLSVLLFPPPPLRRPALLTAWAAVSVCETIRQVAGLEATIKWPNDVLVRGRKVCGILIEQAQGAVVGIGLNVSQTAEDLAGLPRAGSLRVVSEKSFDCAQVARLLIRQLDEQYDHLCAGDLATLERHWRGALGLLDNHVAVECHDGTHHGRLRELAWEGLTLELGGGELLRLAPEAVRHLDLAS